VKVTPEHLEQIRGAIAALLAKIEAERGVDEEALRQTYRDRRIPRAEGIKDIDRRFRWDLYWGAARLAGGLPDSTDGYSDAHIDTALRSIVAPL
jgi:hypothetical protein